jgi:hypothetical protein
MAGKRASQNAESDRVFGQTRKPAKMIRAGLYARVSTNDQQTIPLQMRALREYAARRGWTIAQQVKEVGSGASERQRPIAGSRPYDCRRAPESRHWLRGTSSESQIEKIDERVPRRMERAVGRQDARSLSKNLSTTRLNSPCLSQMNIVAAERENMKLGEGDLIVEDLRVKRRDERVECSMENQGRTANCP